MKLQTLFLFGLMVVLTSCPKLFEPIQLVPTSGKIESWQTGKLASVRVRMGDNGNGSTGVPVQINDDGMFSNVIYPTPLVSDLQSIVISPNCASTFTVTPSDVKFTYGTLGVSDSKNNTVGILGYSNTIESSFALQPIGSISVA